MQGFFKLVGKQEVEVVDADVTEDRVDRTAKGWTIGINESWDLLDYLHRAGHQKFTQYTMSDQVAKIAGDPFMGRLAAPVEDARVDWLTSAFFDKPVFENHRKQVRAQLESTPAACLQSEVAHYRDCPLDTRQELFNQDKSLRRYARNRQHPPRKHLFEGIRRS